MANTHTTPTVFDVADWFLTKADISPKRLQKLVYYVQAWSYTLFDKPLMYSDEKPAEFEAWAHGPVNADLYSKYRAYGWNPIITSEQPKYDFNMSETDLLESVWETYKEYSPNEIENLTHEEDPWINARKRVNANPGDSSNEVITGQEMKAYYSEIYIGD